MHPYHAPVRDLQFVLHEVLRIEEHYRAIGRADVSAELIDSVLNESARFAEAVVAPLNASGDLQGASHAVNRVKTPDGFADAYARFCDDGWASIVAPAQWGGQGLPSSMEVPLSEMLSAANLAWRTYSGLSTGAILAISAHASTDLQAAYLPKLCSGEWLPTMCLTEPHCGSDLALIRARAEPASDGRYRISGNKIFITGGEHDLTPNIVHLVLAKLPDAPEGSKGISLFLVPKFIHGADGKVRANGVTCSSIEHKLGIRGSATCVLDFNEAEAWLVGRAHGGLACMFTMLNHARLAVGVQGIGVAELARQGAVRYAMERRQGRAPGAGEPAMSADPIIGHPDVRRMLLTQKALVEGCRMLACFVATQIDVAHHGADAERKSAADLVALLTPIVKAFCADAAVECASLDIQVHGGHGYIKETGAEQLLRDARILPIYEGTNGIQALDYLGRKVLGSASGGLDRLIQFATEFCDRHASDARIDPMIRQLRSVLHEWTALTDKVRAHSTTAEVAAAAHDYLQFSGYASLAWCWARMAAVAAAQLRDSPGSLYHATKVATAEFYFDRLLPRADAHARAARSGARILMMLDAAQLAS